MPTKKTITKTTKTSKPVASRATKPKEVNNEAGELAIVVDTNGLYAQLELEPEIASKLEEFAVTIERHRNKALEEIIAIGKAAIAARELLSLQSEHKLDTKGTFVKWAEERICQQLGFSYQSLVNWMNLAERLPQDELSMQEMANVSPTALYELMRPTFPEDLRAAVLDNIPPKLTRTQIHSIRKLNQLASAQEKKIEPAAIVLLSNVDAIPPTALAQISRLEPQEQAEVAEEIANDRNKGLEILRGKDRQRSNAVKTFQQFNSSDVGFRMESRDLTNLEEETLDAIVVEAPLSSEWLHSYNGLSNLDKQLDRVLKPSGVAIVFMGHRSILFSGNLLSYLSPLTILTARRTPGNTPMLPGINLGYSAVHAILAYKPPMRKTSKITFDLQTGVEENTTDASLLNVETGIEKAICKFLDSLVEEHSNVGHLQIGTRGFSLCETLSDKARELNADAFYSLSWNASS
jgi:hypothetical protein